MSNGFRTAILLAALTGLILWVGGVLGGQQGMVIAFLFAAVTNFVGYWFSDRIVLASYRARRVEPNELPMLHRIANNLRVKAGLPVTPALYVIPTEALNAFATGRNPQHAAVAVTEGILRLLSEQELEGVLAHELAHVKNRDILTSSIAATLAGAIMMLASMARWAMIFGGMQRDERDGRGGLELLAMMIFAPLAATLIQLAISRGREYAADESGARTIGNPLALASALEKLEAANQRLPLDASPATAHLFIVNPLSGMSLARLFSTHPPTQDRVARLRAMAGMAA
ncbi:MAG TPA: zinc metalloprotease HtpX [Candidatus Binatia bacterium]|nr:zinc metalloprotease HtpX [Candidatus Binatia bacterium]